MGLSALSSVSSNGTGVVVGADAASAGARGPKAMLLPVGGGAGSGAVVGDGAGTVPTASRRASGAAVALSLSTARLRRVRVAAAGAGATAGCDACAPVGVAGGAAASMAPSPFSNQGKARSGKAVIILCTTSRLGLLRPLRIWLTTGRPIPITSANWVGESCRTSRSSRIRATNSTISSYKYSQQRLHKCTLAIADLPKALLFTYVIQL